MLPIQVDRMLPTMRCDAGCSDCCGPVITSRPEYDRVIEYATANGISPVDNGITCPWFQQGRCAVHAARPTVCRLFGHSDRLVCSKGYNVNVSRNVEMRINGNMMAEARATGAHYLHDVLGEGAGVRAMLSALNDAN